MLSYRSRLATLAMSAALFLAPLPALAQPIGSFADGAPLAPSVHGQSGSGLSGLYFGTNFTAIGPHIQTFGTAPVLSTCGTSPVADTGNNDAAGTFTTGSAATTCTLTFAVAYGNAPSCIVQGKGTATQPTYTVTTTAITMSVSIASTPYSYICISKQGGG